MDPQQSDQPKSSGSDYDFFMNPEAKPPPQNPIGKFGGNNSMAVRIAVVAVGAFILIIIISIAVAILGGSSSQPALIKVTQDQTELIRVANQVTQIGNEQASQTLNNFSQSASLSLVSAQTELLNFMATHGGKPDSKLLAQSKNSQTDASLSAAVAASNFNSTFKTVMKAQLTNYEADLQAAYADAKSSTLQQILNGDYNDATLLVKQLGDPDQ